LKLNYKNGEEYYYKIFQIFNLSVAVTLLPFGYLVLEKHSGNLNSIPMSSWLHWVIVLPTIGAISWFIVQVRKKHATGKEASQKMESLREKLSSYYFVLRKTFIAFGLACTLTVLLLWLTGSGIYIIIYVVIMILLSLSRPTLNLIIEDLKLGADEESCLIKKETIE